MMEDEKSLGELPTLGVDGKVAGGSEGWESMHSVGSAATMGRPGEGIVDDGRTDGGRRWRAGEEILGRYVVVRELGQGGMGVVYECLDKVAGVKVAVKCLPPELSHDREEMEEVRENFRLVYGLSHPNIAGVRQLEQDGSGEFFLVMELAEGETLRRWIRVKRKEGNLGLGEVVGVLRQVAAALDYAHSEKVIHRDVKPGNVMIDGRGRVKVLDFGLAAQVRSSLSRASKAYRGTSGTGPYMAPEQWEGQPQDAKTDQYALGVMAYEMLAGRLPFENSELGVLKDAVLNGEVAGIPGLSRGAMGALRRALAKRAKERWESCGAFVEGLAEGRGGGSERWSAHGKTLMGWLAALAVGALVVGAWWAGWGRATSHSESSPQQTGAETSTPVADEMPVLPEEDEAAKRAETEEARKALEVVRQKPEEDAAHRQWELEERLAKLEQHVGRSEIQIKTMEGEVTAPALGAEKTIDLGGGVKLEMVWCPAGPFTMGSSNGEDDEKPEHEVRLTRGFWMAKTEVTQAQWKSVMEYNPSSHKGDDLPVETVSWDECRDFCQKAGMGLRLPTEAEWEYACRAGTAGDYGGTGNLDDMGWYADNHVGMRTHPVGKKQANAWDLYDMHGNVLEWCEDWYDSDYYAQSPEVDPKGAASGVHHVLRGGSWFDFAQNCRSAHRGWYPAGYCSNHVGFRPVCSAGTGP